VLVCLCRGMNFYWLICVFTVEHVMKLKLNIPGIKGRNYKVIIGNSFLHHRNYNYDWVLVCRSVIKNYVFRFVMNVCAKLSILLAHGCCKNAYSWKFRKLKNKNWNFSWKSQNWKQWWFFFENLNEFGIILLKIRNFCIISWKSQNFNAIFTTLHIS